MNDPAGWGRLVAFCQREKFALLIITLLLAAWGVAVAPFNGPKIDGIDPVAVDAIPNLGENQQIVFAEWPGRSPRDVEDQITYPLSTALMGVAGVRDVRAISMFGFSSVAVIFHDDVEFYWSRTRLLEKLGSLSGDILPAGVQPALGPDATGLGQVFWYTLEGRDQQGRPVGGWDLHELRSLQDWTVRFSLLSAEGISEVASIGGYTREYHIEVDLHALRIHQVSLADVEAAARQSNLDVGAGTTEINGVEYLVRGVGLVSELSDLENAPVRLTDGQVAVRIKDVAHVTLGPGIRVGALDVSGAEAVGGVVTVREGYNPQRAIGNLKERIAEISRGLPARPVIDWQQTTPAEVEAFGEAQGLPQLADHTSQQWSSWLRAHPELAPQWLRLSQLTLIPFYDRTQLISETLGTLNDALIQQLLITLVVILVLLAHLRAAIAVGLMLPMAVLMAFIGMKLANIEANIIALAGIAIAVGTIVDMGIIITDNVLRQLKDRPDAPLARVINDGVTEVASAIVTAITTTVISFLPVFVMTGAEGKLFTPLAYTKTFVLMASVLLALTLVPLVLEFLLQPRRRWRSGWHWMLLAVSLLIVGGIKSWRGVTLIALLPAAAGLWYLWVQHLPVVLHCKQRARERLPDWAAQIAPYWPVWLAVFLLVLVTARFWQPLGPVAGTLRNILFVSMLFGFVLGLFAIFLRFYDRLLIWCLAHKGAFLTLPLLLIVFGLNVWLGFDRTFGFVPNILERVGLNGQSLRNSDSWQATARTLPGLGREFMPALDEGTFLWMPSAMPHASRGEILDMLQQQDLAIAAIPEVATVVGKAGRADTPLDPAPMSMFETIIQYHDEYRTDENGRRLRFAYDRQTGDFLKDDQGELIPDARGRPYRQWRDHIRSPDDIWQAIAAAAHLPGTTLAPKLQPIETRLLMLQTGMRAALGIKLTAPDLESLDRAALTLEQAVRQAPGVDPQTVNADRVVGKPWFEIHIDRPAAARYGLSVTQIQNTISAAIGGIEVGRTVEGRERYPIRVRYQRDHRQTPEQMGKVLIHDANQVPIPLEAVTDIRYTRGPQMIRTENTFLTAYVTFGAHAGWSEVDVVDAVQQYLDQRYQAGNLSLDAGVNYSFAGNYQNQQRAAATLLLVVPMALAVIFLLLYFQFRSVSTALIVFSGVAVAWAGGFVAIFLYAQDWFGNFSVLGANLRELFQLQPVNLSIAVWVGFLALFGIAVDDGVVMATYLQQQLRQQPAQNIAQLRLQTLAAAQRRVKPCLMTSATTILALLPVLTATGRGADLMIPMAIPTLGGLTFVLLSMFVVPVLFCWAEEREIQRGATTI